MSSVLIRHNRNFNISKKRPSVSNKNSGDSQSSDGLLIRESLNISADEMNTKKMRDRDKVRDSSLGEITFRKANLSANVLSDFERSHGIGKKYFDVYSDRVSKNSSNKFSNLNRFSLNLPPIKKQHILVDSFLEKQMTASKRSSTETTDEDQSVLKKRAIRRVDQIYAAQKSYVDQKYQKIKRIKDRLRILEKIDSDKSKLHQKYYQ